MVTAFWMKETLFTFETKVSAEGTVVVHSQGPVEQIEMNDEQVVTDGRYVIARTEGVKYKARRAAQSLLGSYLSGGGAPDKLLISLIRIGNSA